MEKFRSLMGLLKPELPIAAGICVIAGQSLALGEAPDLDIAILGFLIGFLISGSEMVSNDLFDIQVDRINHPDRPLPSGKVSVREVVIFTALLSLSGLSIAAFLGLPVLAFAAFLWALGLLYNWRLKALGPPGNAIVALSVGATFILGGMTVVTILFSAFIVLGLIPFLMGWLGLPYLAVMLMADGAVAYLVTRLWRTATPEQGRRIQRLLYLMMIGFILVVSLMVII